MLPQRVLMPSATVGIMAMTQSRALPEFPLIAETELSSHRALSTPLKLALLFGAWTLIWIFSIIQADRKSTRLNSSHRP